MKRHNNQAGSGATGLLVVLVVFVIIAVAGYKVWQRSKVVSTTPPSVSLRSSSTAAGTAVPATISNKTDLNQASNALDANDLTSLDGSNLNTDINSLL